ncbi:bifunctional phosphopantothenoylcysteine decarboxylase/phosphopantothenate--cysteine ligase CoaBC [Rheinheimera sp. F8]|uniref:bifunctional phosphopantothenoylcysteine decarboxylase/phosphopantothenate--cysteine ligase CoaBC n=1 Tax=Rheinheimera sp. F8 TaxID=1763998 RepID=UPI000744C950|nr:bifunctional phosphopantothenoylcysteine decarboxylase/phosphopantothenate--cysteine ligase CoaBC [Rheinheimera sp. F8]ALZ77864.1 phosphopantothenoylcysteine decarboxylase [Rheinheimera sp. F8]ALZ77902.1 phosphopantothenoylcysteine decarboxylase [Rheinheimera sp. F8]
MHNILAGKKILLGISGGIAAYKSADLVRRLKERGADVRVILTPAAAEFITPLTLQALSGNPVGQSLLDPAAEAAMGHIELAKWADFILVAPASADVIARITHGLANDLLTTCILASNAPLAIAPAMNQQMYKNIATQANLSTLISRNIHIFGPNAGEQACGDVGPGRMLEPLQLVDAMIGVLAAPAQQPLQGVKVTITAGPTREAIDPVRYISNHSSGKMGYALATAAAALGAEVTLISGPVQLATPTGVTRIDVTTAEQMYVSSMQQAPNSDIFIGCAAVADFRVAALASQKIKKTADNDGLTLQLVKNPDIIASVAALTTQRPFTVGFAAETEKVAEYARQKLQKKNLNLICANDVSDPALGFNSEQNAITVYSNTAEFALGQRSKTDLAQALISLIYEQYQHEKKH